MSARGLDVGSGVGNEGDGGGGDVGDDVGVGGEVTPCPRNLRRYPCR